MECTTFKEKPVVLVIDDEEIIRTSIRNFLEDDIYHVLEAKNGHEGLIVFDQNKPDIVLVDIQIPKIDGLQVLESIKNISPDTPTIMISGAGKIEETVEAIRLGAEDYLIKPFEDMSFLLHALERALERSRLIKENREHQEHLEAEVIKRTKDLESTNNKLRKANQLIRDQQKKELEEERLKVLLQMAGTTAHELGQPLTVLLGCIEIILKTQDIPENLAKLIGRINDAGQRIAGIVKKIQSIRHYEIKNYVKKLSIIDIEQKLNNLSFEEIHERSHKSSNTKFIEIIEWEVSKARRYDTDLALCLIGPEKLNEINNTYGQSAGNMFLSEISKMLNECIRESDFCCRYGDDEFALVMPNTETKAGNFVCERIRDTLNQNQFKYNSSQFPLTSSIGFALFKPSQHDNSIELMEMANKALCVARAYSPSVC